MLEPDAATQQCGADKKGANVGGRLGPGVMHSLFVDVLHPCNSLQPLWSYVLQSDHVCSHGCKVTMLGLERPHL